MNSIDESSSEEESVDMKLIWDGPQKVAASALKDYTLPQITDGMTQINLYLRHCYKAVFSRLKLRSQQDECLHNVVDTFCNCFYVFSIWP